MRPSPCSSGTTPADAQTQPSRLIPGDTVVIVPGIGYGASAVRGWFMGYGYRDLWTAPVRVEVASLDRLAGMRDWGRVYVSGDSPGGWHTSYGGGVWVAPIDRGYTASAVLARSESFTGLYVRSGFHF